MLSLLLLLLSALPCSSQTTDPFSFFPASAGNRWEYEAIGIPSDTFSFAIYRDSLDDAGNHWLATSGGSYLIDTAYCVWNYSGTFDRMTADLLYKLDANSGDSWVVLRYSDSTTNFTAHVRDVVRGSVFGQESTVKIIDYYKIISEPHGQDSIWFWTRYLAEGFGWIRWNVEPSPQYIMVGAVVSGKRWGKISSVAEHSVLDRFSQTLLEAFPNPSHDRVLITWRSATYGPVTLRLFDVLGRERVVLFENTMLESGTHSFEMDLSPYSDGIYFCRIETREGADVQQIVKQ